MFTLTDKQWLEIGHNALILLLSVAVAKLVQMVLLQILLRVNNWFRSNLDRSLETYARRPLFFLLTGAALSIAFDFTTIQDKWIERLQLGANVLTIICTGWLFIGLVRGTASWMESHYADGKSRDMLAARRFSTQIRVLTRVAMLIILVLTCIGVALVIPNLRKLGVSLFASAGVAGLVIGMAANSTLSNLIAGIQIAITQPILLGDEVFINGLTGRVEEIRASYLVIKLEDMRRMIIPFNWFMSNPIVNSTYEGQGVVGSFTFSVPLSADIDKLRRDLQSFAKDNPRWDGKVCTLLVNGNKEQTLELKAQLSARYSHDLNQLLSDARQKLLIPLQKKSVA